MIYHTLLGRLSRNKVQIIIHVVYEKSKIITWLTTMPTVPVQWPFLHVPHNWCPSRSSLWKFSFSSKICNISNSIEYCLSMVPFWLRFNLQNGGNFFGVENKTNQYFFDKNCFTTLHQSCLRDSPQSWVLFHWVWCQIQLDRTTKLICGYMSWWDQRFLSIVASTKKLFLELFSSSKLICKKIFYTRSFYKLYKLS